MHLLTYLNTLLLDKSLETRVRARADWSAKWRCDWRSWLRTTARRLTTKWQSRRSECCARTLLRPVSWHCCLTRPPSFSETTTAPDVPSSSWKFAWTWWSRWNSSGRRKYAATPGLLFIIAVASLHAFLRDIATSSTRQVNAITYVKSFPEKKTKKRKICLLTIPEYNNAIPEKNCSKEIPHVADCAN